MWYAVGIIGGAIVGGIFSNMAADKQSDAAKEAAALSADANAQAAAAMQRAAESGAAAVAAAQQYSAGLISKAALDAANQTAQAHEVAAQQATQAYEESKVMVTEASNKSMALQKQMYGEAEQKLSPWMQSGETANNQLSYGLGLSGYENKGNADLGEAGYLQRDFEMSDFKEDPGYQFRLDEGIKALDRSASARGNLLSGSTLKGIERFGQGLASQEYQAAYDRYTGEQDRKYNQLSGVSQTGLGAAGTLSALGMSYASSAGNTMTNSAQFLSGSNMQTANAIGQSGVTAAQNQGQYGINAANAIGQGAMTAAQYQAQLAMTAAGATGQYGINGADSQANAALLQGNADAGMYRGWGDAAATGVNQLGQYYGMQNRQQGSTSNSNWVNPDTGQTWANSGNSAKVGSQSSYYNRDLATGDPYDASSLSQRYM